ncbi:class I mannose-6-phosphate isomerase [Atopococcus tabaci]|uniref:class I mannose-6-phosphate isomerase n=1 Tax=Atopococcus tabaci TaxID=269774 RepID=UPI00040F8CD2|nr:class I mannose-6-phosphate isomerase [Atopococcus tabaci]
MYRLRPGLKLKKPVEVTIGIENITNKIISEMNKTGSQQIAIESHPGIEISKLEKAVKQHLPEALVFDTEDLFLSSRDIFKVIQEDLTEDKVFGRFSHRNFFEFISPIALKRLYEKVQHHSGPVVALGVCASDVITPDTLIYLDIPRWEIQKRYKKGLINWKGYKETDFSEKLKRAYYFEWPAALELKENILPKCDFYIDMTDENEAKMIHGSDMREHIFEFTQQPFRLVPFFEPGVWGGKWMQEKFDVGRDEVNLAWCFDGVPEENSIILFNDGIEIEMPAQNIVSLYPKELLGRKVFGRYGKDFPIRFDYLDTMDGQNLSLQVHPTLDYAYRNFGAKYTQDESYYILDCKKDAKVYLGVKNEIEASQLVSDLEKAQETGEFNDEKYINQISVKKHDHLLIPGGTIHSSGRDCVVLEISSTPNRFTFKLWDWGRLDLDGKPRPISIHHGKHVINTDFDETFVQEELYNKVDVMHEQEGFREERTGLHELESIETRRLIFSRQISQKTEKSVNMLNLVEGDHIKVLSPTDQFEPFDVYYGETFIIPEKVVEYDLVPVGEGKEVMVLKAYIR